MAFNVPTDPVLTGLQNVMQYNAVTGNPELRVNIGGGIEINGTVNIPGIIQVQSSAEDPVDMHIRQVGTSGILAVPYLPVNVTNFPATQPVSIATLPSISGSVSVTNFPATQPVSIAAMPSTPVTGTFWQNTQPVSIAAMPSTPVTGTFWQDTQPVSIANMPITQVTGTFWQATQPVSIAAMPSTPVTGTFWPATQPISGTVSISNFPDPMPVSIGSMPSTPVTGTFWPTIQPVSGTVTVQQGTSPWIIGGQVDAQISTNNIINVVVNENPGKKYGFNNHAAAANRGWVMDNVMRPLISLRVNGSGTTAADLIEIVEYQIGNNNANQSTIVYEWYEGDLTIAGAAIPSWTNVGTKCQYRVYQDQYSSNQGNTFTVPADTYLRHCGIVIGKNSDNDEGPEILHGGAVPNMLTLCIKRVDNATELDVWFAFTIREITS